MELNNDVKELNVNEVEVKEILLEEVVLCQYFGHKKSNFFMLHF